MRIFIYRYCYLIFLTLLSFASNAQQYNFKNYTPINGLTSSLINNIFQDSKGYLWFSTQGGGVSKFNGKEFQNYTHKEGLVYGDITCIREDKEGNIWIASGTDGGVSKFDGTNFENYTTKEGLPDNSVYWIYCDAQNKVWLATMGGVVIYSNGVFSKISTSDTLSSKGVNAVTQDRNGIYWFALENGVSSFDGTQITNYAKHKKIYGKSFFSVLCDKKNNIWFGSTTGDVVKYNGKTFESLTLPEEVSNDFIGSIAEDKHENLWLATGHGAVKYDGYNYTLFNEKNGLLSNIVTSICPDYDGNVWIGTQQGGASILNNEAFVGYTTHNGLISNKITAICQNSDNEYIIGTLGLGLTTFSNNVFRTLKPIPELENSIIACLFIDSKNNLWVGTDNEVFVLSPNNGSYQLNKRFKKLADAPLYMATNITEDKHGNIWIASYGSGLFKLTGNSVKHFSTATGLASDNVLTMYKDNNETLWLGTNDAGVIKIARDKITNYSENDGLSSKSVWSIAEDNKHNMYFATSDAGICGFDGTKFYNYTTKDGLCSNNITTLLWDKTTNSLFAGTDKGINRFQITSGFKIDSLRYYGESEGFKGIEVSSNAVLKDNQGYIWFGTTNGLYRYNSRFDYPITVPPHLVLTNIKMFYQAVDWSKYTNAVDVHTNLPKNLQLSYSNNHLTFSFQALTTSEVRYTYILEGQDDEWSPLSSTPEASFTNIAPGKTYTFKVKAVNNNGLWSTDDISYTFTIRPPWWRTWWAYTLYAIFSVATVWAYIGYRTSKLKKEKQVLEEKVTERTIELNASNLRLSEAIHTITDSMNYAQRIQQSFLTSEKLLDNSLKNYFILYKPQNIVSGDFYWAYDMPDRTLVACADSTGHGIPGAFMSLIGISLLNEITHSKNIYEPTALLNELRRIIILALNPEQSDEGGKDGMDMALISIFKNKDASGNTKIHFACANNTLCVVSNENNQPQLTEYKGDKQPVGFYSNMKPFTPQEITVKKGDMLYMFTDGFPDQFGGPKGKKFMAKQLKKVLQSLYGLPQHEQKQKLENIYHNWKGNIEQIDDITVMGVLIS